MPKLTRPAAYKLADTIRQGAGQSTEHPDTENAWGIIRGTVLRYVHAHGAAGIVLLEDLLIEARYTQRQIDIDAQNEVG
jgi:hypothetical protein